MQPRCRAATRVGVLLAIALGLPPRAGIAAPAPQTQDVTGILERIRQDVGNYELQAARWRGDVPPRGADPAMPPKGAAIACPKSVANYDFDVTRIQLTLQVLAQSTASADAGLKVAVGALNVHAGASGESGQSSTQTIVLDRIPDYAPADLAKFRTGADYANLTANHQAWLAAHPGAAQADAGGVFPISTAIIALRRNLLAATAKLPCFDVARSGSGDVLTFAFEVTKAVDPTIGFDLLVVSAQADDKLQNKLDNTIAVTIAPHTKAPRSSTRPQSYKGTPTPPSPPPAR